MVRAGRRGIIAVVAAVAGVWSIGIVTLVAGCAIVRNGNVRPYKRVNRIVIKRRWSPGRFAVTTGAICGELSGGVVRIGRSGIVAVVTAVASVGRIVVVAVVAGSTVVGNGRVCPIQSVVIIVNRERCWFPTGCSSVAHRAIRWNG